MYWLLASKKMKKHAGVNSTNPVLFGAERIRGTACSGVLLAKVVQGSIPAPFRADNTAPHPAFEGSNRNARWETPRAHRGNGRQRDT
jgi:hypothetical protein